MRAHGAFVPFAITVCGLDELADHCKAGVTHVLSLTDPDHPELSAFGAYGAHARLELRFHDVIDEGPGVRAPQAEDVARLLAFGRDLAAGATAAAHLLVHCHAGVSRSTAAMTLLLAQARPDRPAREAVAEVVRVRPIAWPNLRIVALGDALLGRDGEIVAAVREHHRRVCAADPFRAERMIASGRGHEVAD